MSLVVGGVWYVHLYKTGYKVKKSIVFDVVEVLGIEDGFLESPFVLGVAETGPDTGVVDVVEGVFSEEGITDDPETLGLGLRFPKIP
jgi:hypothetical protein